METNAKPKVAEAFNSLRINDLKCDKCHKAIYYYDNIVIILKGIKANYYHWDCVNVEIGE